MLKQLPELLDAQPGIPHNTAHRKCIHWIMSGDRQNARPIGHDNMCTLTKNAKSGFFQRGDGSQMVNSRQLGHNLPRQLRTRLARRIT
jgi:hypothetical protein